MRKSKELVYKRGLLSGFIRAMVCVLALFPASERAAYPREPESLWAHDRLIPWVVGVYDPKPLTPEERARMLERLGFKKFAYFWEPDKRDIHGVDAEIEALQRHGIDIVAWWFSYDAQDPFAKSLLEEFRRYHIHPALWVAPTYRDVQTAWREHVPENLSEPDRATMTATAMEKAWKDSMRATVAATPEEQRRRVTEEAGRIGALVKLAAPYGNPIALYNHGGWSGIEDNQVAIIERLKSTNIGNVGIVYAFNHVRNEYHDDTTDFPSLWARIQRYVVAVTLTGICMDDGSIAYPSQGDGELAMMRTIQESGWRGEVGVFAGEWHGRGDAETTLRNILIGVDWITAELKRPGSGGAHPFPVIALSNQNAN